MSYSCYLGGVEWPTPAKLTVKIKGKNKTLTLLNEGEINFLRTPGLSEIVLPVTLSMLTGSRSPSYYMGVLERLKTSKGTTQFILVRRSPDGRRLFDTNMTVSVEDYNITEDAKEGLDVSVDINLKQWALLRHENGQGRTAQHRHGQADRDRGKGAGCQHGPLR